MNTIINREPAPGTAWRVRGWMAAHPVGAYLVVTFALSWAAWLPLV